MASKAGDDLLSLRHIKLKKPLKSQLVNNILVIHIRIQIVTTLNTLVKIFDIKYMEIIYRMINFFRRLC